MTGPLVIVGDALLDRDVNGRAARLCPDAPAPALEDAREVLRPGGAALAGLLAAASGAAPILIAPLRSDPASAAVRSLLPAQVTVVPLPLLAHPTGLGQTGLWQAGLAEKTRYRAGGRTLLRVDRPAGPSGRVSAEALAAIDAAGTLLVCDSTRTPRSVSSANCGRTSGSRAGTTKARTCRRRPRYGSGTAVW